MVQYFLETPSDRSI